MSESIKLTTEEISAIKNLQEKFQQQIQKIGKCHIRKIKTEQALKQISEQVELFDKELSSLEQEESKLIDGFLVKYGEGALDLNAGVFVPDARRSQTPQ